MYIFYLYIFSVFFVFYYINIFYKIIQEEISDIEYIYRFQKNEKSLLNY